MADTGVKRHKFGVQSFADEDVSSEVQRDQERVLSPSGQSNSLSGGRLSEVPAMNVRAYF